MPDKRKQAATTIANFFRGKRGSLGEKKKKEIVKQAESGVLMNVLARQLAARLKKGK